MKMCRNCYVEQENDKLKSRGWCARCLDDKFGKDCKNDDCDNGTFNETGICDDCVENEQPECSSCQGTGIDMHCHNSVAPQDVGNCKAYKGSGKA